MSSREAARRGRASEQDVAVERLGELARRLRTRRAAAGERLATFMRNALSGEDPVPDGQFDAGLRELAGAYLDSGLLAIELGEEWHGPIPPIVRVQEGRAIRNGVEVSSSMDAYITANTHIWGFILEEVCHSEISDFEKALMLRRAYVATQSLLARMLAEVVAVHMEAVKRDLSRSAQRQVEVARRILAGGPADHPALDYDFDIEHVGVIAWGHDVERTLLGVASSLGYQRWIVESDGEVWAWLGASRGCSAREIERALEEHPTVFAAIGDPARGPQGFRETHAYAQGAYRVAQRSGRRITMYADVADEARALQDPLHARWLIRTYLAPIEAHRDAGTLLRTLEKLYEAARNMDKAARILGNVDRHTVRRRIDKISGIIDRDLRDHHNDMELALRLARLEGLGGGGSAE